MSLDTLTTSLIDLHTYIPSWVELASQGLADATAAVAETTKVCPDFGQPGWAPFCFLNGNPVFNAFDTYQLFIQNSVVSLHDFLAVSYYYYYYYYY
jgi:hypothetical protein